jgi:transposase
LTLQSSLSSVQKKEFEAGEILSSDFCDGRTHDFRLFKESGATVQPHVLILADAGYQGIATIQKTAEFRSFKRKKNCPLSEEEKKVNRDLSKQRITVEHIFRKLKIFCIFREKYRNRRKRYALRFNFIAAACCNLAIRLS